MQTLKSCEIQDLYKHVCYKDLLDYIRKDELYDTLNGLCDAELEKIKNVLGITSVYVEKVLRDYSPNAIANGTVTAALRNKVEKSELAKVAFSGDFYDLRVKPCELPNPGTLLLKLEDGILSDGIAYKGENDVLVNLYEWLTNFLTQHINEYVTPLPECDCPVKGITLNGVTQTPDSCGIVNLRVQEPDLSKYCTINYFQSAIGLLLGEIEGLKNRITVLESKSGGGEDVNP